MHFWLKDSKGIYLTRGTATLYLLWGWRVWRTRGAAHKRYLFVASKCLRDVLLCSQHA